MEAAIANRKVETEMGRLWMIVAIDTNCQGED
jgi:hypothetical protein